MFHYVTPILIMSEPVATPASVACPNCGNTNPADQVRCFNCQRLLPKAGTSTEGGASTLVRRQMPVPAGVEAGTLSRISGWIILLLGCIGGLVIIAKHGSVEVGFGQVIQNPVAVWGGLAVILQSIMWTILSLAVAAAAENSAEMRREIWDLRSELRAGKSGD
jgi:hypothetical protein